MSWPVVAILIFVAGLYSSFFVAGYFYKRGKKISIFFSPFVCMFPAALIGFFRPGGTGWDELLVIFAVALLLLLIIWWNLYWN